MIKSIKDNIYYVGISENPKRRVQEHNTGKLKNTSKNKPFFLVFLKEHKDYKSARVYEKWLKKKSFLYKTKLAQLAPPDMGVVLAPPDMGVVLAPPDIDGVK